MQPSTSSFHGRRVFHRLRKIKACHACFAREVPLIRALAFSKRLAGMAAQLLHVKRLRLYQDCVFVKQPGFTETNWHSDASLSPLDTNDFVTAWIPLRPIMVRSRACPLL